MTTKKRVYIAGPITKGDLAHNINQGTEAFIALAKAGFAPFCPQWSCFSGKTFRGSVLPVGEDGSQYYGLQTIAVAGVTPNELTHTDWYGVDLPWVEVSHAVLRLPGESTGADLEVACAIQNGVEVFYRDNFPSLKAVVECMKAVLSG